LVDPDKITVNGVAADKMSTTEGRQEVIDIYTGGGGLTVTLVTGAGVYADLADLCGDYVASVKISGVEYSGLILNTNAVMEAKTTVKPAYLISSAAVVTGAGAPSSSSSTQVQALNSFYGYAIDLFFRTNAANSELRLQIEEAQRIYNAEGDVSKNEETQGGGSNMTFTSSSASFSTDNMKELMKAIRIVFMHSTTGEIYAQAELDVANSTTTGMTVVAPLSIGEWVTVAETNTKSWQADENQTILSLTQNQATPVTVVVYLDGNAVTNADVANGTNSMTGSLNLQFKSSADLVPMRDSDLFDGEVSGGETTTEAVPVPSEGN